MGVSNVGLDIIKQFESCYLKAYKFQAGVWNIGYGTTNADKSIIGTEIYEGLIIDQKTADKLLEKAINVKYAPLVDKYNSTYHFTQNQFNALVSFCYNISSIEQLVDRGNI